MSDVNPRSVLSPAAARAAGVWNADPNVWYADAAASGPRWRRWAEDGWHLVVYEDGRWFCEHNGKMRGSGEAIDMPSAKAIVVYIMEHS